ncbi:MAG: Lrp/AsnC family transcriptional regulator [Acetobacteraceae bacterium]|nr:Lrp/AsnC family transcriptional regulator [Acetobacteraceae bacterium]
MAKSPPPDLDATDRRILRTLQRDGRMPLVALAEAVGLSATPCQRRLKRLEEAGVIQGYAARLDAGALGYAITAFVQVALVSHAEDVVERFHKALAQRPEIVAAFTMSGEMDYLLQVVAPDMAAFGEFAMKTLLRMPGVKETRSSFVLEVLKPPGQFPV